MNGGKLRRELKALRADWDQTREYWRDSKAREFEQKYMVDLGEEVARAASTMDELETLIKTIRHECE